MLENNITFAILKASAEWRTDLSSRFAEYFCHKLNKTSSRNRLIFVSSVDDALARCETDFLIVQGSGHLIVDNIFFDNLETIADKNTDLIIGDVRVEEDYMRLRETCMFINMLLWHRWGKPRFNGPMREAPRISAIKVAGTDLIATITADTGGEKIGVPSECSAFGAGLLVKQLELFGQIQSIESIRQGTFYLDKSSPYHEIHYETLFEKQILDRARRAIFTIDNEELPDLDNFHVDLAIIPAVGLRPLSVIQKYGVKKLKIYDSNPQALELQRQIFSISAPAVYGEIVKDFQARHPSAIIADNFLDEQHVGIPLVCDVDIEYCLVDACSFEIEDLIRAQDAALSLLIDFADIYVYPFNFFKKPQYQIQGLFGEVYSLLKCRTAPTKILGLAPGWQCMDTVKVNTDAVQFDAEIVADFEKKSVQPSKEKKNPSLFWSLSKLGERTRDILPNFLLPAVKASEIPDRDKMLAEPQTADQHPKIASNDLTNSSIAAAHAAAYTIDRRNFNFSGAVQNCLVFTKVQDLEGLEILFEYVLNEQTQAWKFFAGKPGNSEKRIEFGNGINTETLEKHLALQIKINPRAAAKYFG